ncbi:hypothetical protein FRB96_005936 [Tulasnella sp. 330]|nr:hypothetical protein FRB96_005936 [Tulasnella sp. 330]KAG8871194.1 hypothetical protein FRB97_008917 [Tulasnella sp. 331]KAG8873469.1 hypothetical protein FRB98_009008 [Tulasnella sp. 332]
MSIPRQRKDSDASVKIKRNLSFTGIAGLRRRSTVGSGSDSGSETRVPIRGSLVETQRKDDGTRKNRKLQKDRSESGYASGVGSDSEASDIEGGGTKLKRLGTIASRMFSVRKRTSSDAGSLPKVITTAEASTSTSSVPESNGLKPPAPTPIKTNTTNTTSDGVQLMTPVPEEPAGRPSPIGQENTQLASLTAAANESMDLGSPLAGNTFVIVNGADTPEGGLTRTATATSLSGSDEDSAARTIQRNWRRAQANNANAAAAAIKEKQDAAARKIQSSWRRTRSRSASPLDEPEPVTEPENVNDAITAAIKARQESAARTIQKSWKRNRTGPAVDTRAGVDASAEPADDVNVAITAAIKEKQDAAARTIQKSWKRRNNTKNESKSKIQLDTTRAILNGEQPQSPLVPSKETLQVTANYAVSLCIFSVVLFGTVVLTTVRLCRTRFFPIPPLPAPRRLSFGRLVI